jgi:hypothetical protein
MLLFKMENELRNLTQVGGVNDFISSIEKLTSELTLMGQAPTSTVKLAVLIGGAKEFASPLHCALREPVERDPHW